MAIGADVPAPALSLEAMAELAIDECRNFAEEKKLPPLSVAVVDESGTLVRFERQTGASPLTAEAATLKAQSAVQARSSTADLASQAQDPTVRDALMLLHLTTLPGGVPIMRSDSSLRGAIGVSGAESGDDAECAQRALAAIREQARARRRPATSRHFTHPVRQRN